MTLRAVTKACLAKPGRFGRPISWQGSGQAVDLARRLDPSQVRKITTLRSPENLLGEEWKIDPQDLLGRWEVVTGKDLAEEFRASSELA